MDYEESTGVDRVREKSVGGRPQAPTVRLCRTALVTPVGMGNIAAGHPQHQGRLQPGGTGPAGRLHSIPIPGPGRGNTKERGHIPTCETSGPVPP